MDKEKRKYNRKYYLKHKEKILARAREYYIANKLKILVRQTKKYKENPTYQKEYQHQRRLKQLETNPNALRQYHNDYNVQRRKEDIGYRLVHNLRTRMHHALVGNQKSGSAIDDLGCSMTTFKLYIENQFEEGMTWENYREWHLDHVLPLASFDLTNRMEFLEAANWLNYQPLWAADNIRKSDRMRGKE